MTLPEAIRVGLDNSEIVRVIALGTQGIPIGGFVPTPINQDATHVDVPPALPAAQRPDPTPIVIARLNADASVWRFQAEVMAHVRSIEQQYWSLAQARAHVSSREQAVETAREVFANEQAELAVGNGTVADVAEVAQRLEEFELDLITKKSDVVTAERQFRNILGLTAADNRRIIPVTQAIEAHLEPDWESSLKAMLDHQPDIAQQRSLVRLAELQLIFARWGTVPYSTVSALDQLNGLGTDLAFPHPLTTGIDLEAFDPIIVNIAKSAGLVSEPVDCEDFLNRQIGYAPQAPSSFRRPSKPNTRQSQYTLIRSRARLQKIVHQTTHSLARQFLQVDATYKQFKKASRLRAAAARRLDAQRDYYDEGRVTIDRYLDAVSQHATAVATEAQYKGTYNSAIVALEEAKGTLMAYDNIVVAEPHRKSAYSQIVSAKPDDQTKRASAELPDEPEQAAAPAIEPPPTMPPPPVPPAPMASAPKPEAAKPKTWTFSISIGGAQPIVIKGTIRAEEPAPATPAGK